MNKRPRQSVVRAFEIIKAFHYPGEWVRGCDLSRRTGIPEATVNALVATLASVGAVIRDAQGRYQCALLSVAEFNQSFLNAPRLAPAGQDTQAMTRHSAAP